MVKPRPTVLGVAGPILPVGEDAWASPPGLLVTGYFKAGPRYRTVRRRGTQDWLLTYTIRGSGFYRQPGIACLTKPGDLALLEPGAYHHYGTVPAGMWEFVWAHFIPRPPWLTWLQWPLCGKGLRFLSLSDPAVRRRVRAAFERAHMDTWSGAGGVTQDLALNGLEEVILLVARNRMATGSDRSLSPGIRRVVELLSAQLADRHRVSSLAAVAGLSESRFAHRFKQEAGDSVIAYLMKLRLRQAARLLEFSGASVKEVAATVGFDSAFYFSRQFRRHFQMSPRDYCLRAGARSRLRRGKIGDR